MDNWYEIAIVCATIGLFGVTAYNSYWLRIEIKLSHKPVLVFYVFNKNNILHWKIKNIGKGPATNIVITVEPVNKDLGIPKFVDSERGLGINEHLERPLHKRSESNELTKMICISLLTISYRDMFDKKRKIEKRPELVYYQKK